MKSQPKPDYGGGFNNDLLKQSSVVLMTDRELLEVLDILKDLCQTDPFVMKKVEKLERKFKQNK